VSFLGELGQFKIQRKKMRENLPLLESLFYSSFDGKNVIENTYLPKYT